MENKVSIRINLQQSEVEVQGSADFIESANPTIISLINLLKEHLPVHPPQKGVNNMPLRAVLNGGSSINQLNENSQVYHQAPLSKVNPPSGKSNTTKNDSPYHLLLFQEVLKLGKNNFSKVDVVLLAAYILQSQQEDKPFITRNLNQFLNQADYTVSNLSHFVKLNTQYGKLFEEDKTYLVTAKGDEHLDAIFGSHIEQATLKLGHV
jgi:hypothetical protein